MATQSPSRPQYADDFYLWALDQAERLREMAALRRNEPLDWEDLAEEVEELARSDRRACESHIEQIIAHLLKLEFSTATTSRGHWAVEVTQLRLDLEKIFTPSLRRLVKQGMPQRWRGGRRLAQVSAQLHEPEMERRLPADCPYSFEQVLGADDWLPEPSAAQSVTRPL
ncbi:MAG: DUF29 domain-containing protein [Geminicoccaceae bacterium]